MPGIKISNLPAVASVGASDAFPIVQSGVTSKATISQLSEVVGGNDIVRVATTAALTVVYDNGTSGVGATLTNSGALAALSIDGVTLAVNDIVLVKNQTSAFQNGVYSVTAVGSGAIAWVMTRVAFFDEAAEIDAGDFFTVGEGTVNAKTQWIQTNTGPFTIGTTDLDFESNIVAGTGITKTNNTVALTVPVTMANGGTSKALTADNGGIVYTDADSMEILASTATAGQIVRSGSSSAPSWSTATYPATTTINELLYSSSSNVIAGLATSASAVLTTVASVPTWAATLSMALGGSGKALTAADGGIVYTDVDSMEVLAPTATANQVLMSGSNTAPHWSTPTYPTASGSAGVIIRSDGNNNVYSTSTFADTYSINSILYASSADAVTGLAPANSAVLASSAAGVPTWLGSLTNGQIVIGSTGAIPVANTIAAGANVTVTNGAGSITISSSGNLTWTEVTSSPQVIAVQNAYIANLGGGVAFSLPAAAAVGDVFTIVGKAGIWSITQGAGQRIHVGSTSTTVGAGGSLTAAAATDSVNFVCIVANNEFQVVGGPQTSGFVLV